MRNERITEKAGDGIVTLSSLASAVSSGKSAGLDLHQLNIILKVDLQVGLSTCCVTLNMDFINLGFTTVWFYLAWY